MRTRSASSRAVSRAVVDVELARSRLGCEPRDRSGTYCRNGQFVYTSPALLRAEKKAETLTKLRQAGLDVLIELGVHATSTGDIAKRAGVAVGTFYTHFASKEELVDSLVDEMNKGLATEMLGVFLAPPLPPPRRLVDNLAVVVVEYWAKHARSLPLLTDYLARHADEEMLRMGANKQAVAVARTVLSSLPPSIRLKTSPEFLVAMLVAMWRAAGMFGSALDPAQRKRTAADLSKSTQSLLDVFAPGVLELESTTIVASAFAPKTP